jgi:hypothetical protein
MTFVQKDRIRGSNLAVFIPFRVPMAEALRRADEAGLVIASNKRFSEAIAERNPAVIDNSWPNRGPGWLTGTIAAYEKPGNHFGETIESSDCETGIKVVFPVPKKYRGVKNAILVSNHPDVYFEVQGKTTIVRASAIDIIENFPQEYEGCYLGDSIFDIPTGQKVSADAPGAIKLSRRFEANVTPVIRDYFYRDVPHVCILSFCNLTNPVFPQFRVIVEAPGILPTNTDSSPISNPSLLKKISDVIRKLM